MAVSWPNICSFGSSETPILIVSWGDLGGARFLVQVVKMFLLQQNNLRHRYFGLMLEKLLFCFAFSFFCFFCFFCLFSCQRRKTGFPVKKGISCLLFSVSLFFSLVFYFHSPFSLSLSLFLFFFSFFVPYFLCFIFFVILFTLCCCMSCLKRRSSIYYIWKLFFHQSFCFWFPVFFSLSNLFFSSSSLILSCVLFNSKVFVF